MSASTRCMLPGDAFVAHLAECSCQSTGLPLLATQKGQETLLFPPLFHSRLLPGAAAAPHAISGRGCHVVGVAECALRSDQCATATTTASAWLARSSHLVPQLPQAVLERTSLVSAHHLDLFHLGLRFSVHTIWGLRGWKGEKGFPLIDSEGLKSLSPFFRDYNHVKRFSVLVTD